MRDGDLAQAGDVLARHHAGIDVRQQAGLVEHQLAHRGQIVDRRGVAQRGERIARRRVAQLGLVAEREQRFVCSRRGCAGAGDLQHLVRATDRRARRPRRLGEGAVVADVAAELGQRDEHLARIRDQAAMAAIAPQSRPSAIIPESSAMINPLKNARAPTIAAIAAGRIGVVCRSQSGPTQGDRHMKIGFNAPTAGPLSALDPLTQLCDRRGGHGLRLRDLQRPCRDPDRHFLALPLQRDRRIPHRATASATSS